MKYAAFLRGVNVGGRKMLKDDLLACFSSNPFVDIRAVAQTGNVVFEAHDTSARELREHIEMSLAQRLHMDITVFIFPIQAIKQAIEAYPFAVDVDRYAYVVLTDGAVSHALKEWPGSTIDQVADAPVGFYWSVPKGMTLGFPFAKFLAGKTIAPHTTTRNINTLGKVVGAAG